MKLRIWVAKAARLEEREARQYYTKECDIHLARRFSCALWDMYAMMAEFPGIGNLWEDKNPKYLA